MNYSFVKENVKIRLKSLSDEYYETFPLIIEYAATGKRVANFSLQSYNSMYLTKILSDCA